MVPEINPGKVLRVARWELSRTTGSVGRYTVAVVLVAGVLAAAVGPSLLAGGAGLDTGIYRVGVAPDSPYRPVVAGDSRFVARPPEAELGAAIDLRVTGSGIERARTRKGAAAYAAFRSAVQSYNDARMRAARADGTPGAVAFPVDLTLRYETRVLVDTGDGGDGTDDGNGTDGTGTGGGLAGGGGGDGGGGRLAVPNLGGAVTAGTTTGDPSSVQPPFPFGSLVLAFLFILPMNFVIQSYGSTIMNERINRRGELLLVAPLSPADVVAGKTLPYMLALLAVTVGVAALVGGGPLSVAAVAPVAALFLAATFVGAMFARSFKELTFVTLTVSVFLTSYTFVPAIFTEVTPLALISPLTLVVRDLQGAAVSPVEFLFSTGPIATTALLLFALGTGVYREEDMFTQRPVHLKAMDALAVRVRRAWHVAPVTGALVPFVFLAELLVVALLYPVARSVGLLGIVVTLVGIAVVEELAKSVAVYAGYEHARYGRDLPTALAVGALAGAGFFVGEKATLVVQAVGLTDPTIGTGAAAFPEAAGLGGVGGGAGAGGSPLVAAGLLLAPLALHAVTAAISSVGASRGPNWYAAGVSVAVFVHVAYNLAVIAAVFLA